MSMPLHTRALAVEAAAGAGGIAVRASLLDMRKSGVVPVGGDLGAPGIVHHMWVDALVDPEGPRLTALQAHQPRVAFEPSALTGGESCRDPVARLGELRGAALDDAFARRLSAVQGGARGCSHILTISQVLVAAVSWAFRPGGAHAVAAGHRPGERMFRRDIVVDGSRRADGDLELVAQLTDLAFAPAPPIARPMQRFASLHEVRVVAPIEVATMRFGAVTAGERRRGPDSLDAAAWLDRTPRVAGLRGVTVFRGVSAALMEQLGAVADRPLLDAALMLAPTFIQVCGAMSESWLARAAAADSVLGMGGLPDSCYMWRRGGALDRLRSPEDPVPTL
ncbi:DUF2889 domain-containing protein [bacterium]|nr:DUF2889 domain-containing protein [bacterium]